MKGTVRTTRFLPSLRTVKIASVWKRKSVSLKRRNASERWTKNADKHKCRVMSRPETPNNRARVNLMKRKIITSLAKRAPSSLIARRTLVVKKRMQVAFWMLLVAKADDARRK